MQAKNEESVTHLLNDVVEFARGRLPEPAFRVVEPFLRHYYDFVDADDLQSRSIADLYGAALAHWQTAQRNRFDRFVSCLVFVPRDKYNTDLRQRIANLLADAFNGESVEFTPLLSESTLARIHFVVHAKPGSMPNVDRRELEARLVQVARC